MYKSSDIDKVKYIEFNNRLKRYNCEMKKINYEKTVHLKKYKLNYRMLRYMYNRKKKKEIRKDIISKLKFTDDNINYFSNYKIAVYTSVYGDYDNIFDPLIKPNNIDYFIFTDNDIPIDSMWKKVDYSFNNREYSNIEKNRFIKMHPHLLFPDYKYSIYIDSNIQVISDLTEMVNKMTYYIGFHLHQLQVSVYDQIDSCIIAKKDTKTELLKHLAMLKKEEMPSNLGMVEANVIVREHNEKECINLMESWWLEFLNYSKRDQISLHHCLWKAEVSLGDIACLGPSVRENDSIYVMKHDKKP